MDFAAQLDALTKELVESVTKSSPQVMRSRNPNSCTIFTDLKQNDARAFRRHYERAARGLKSHNFLRTNQFEVKNILDGLQERFSVNHRDDLAAALEDRLVLLRQQPEAWHPEILLLLLELSDQPTFKSNLEDLHALQRVPEDVEPALRWEDIAQEDGWDQDTELWSRVSYSDDSDQDIDDAESHDSANTSTSSQKDDEVSASAAVANAHIISVHGEDTLETIRQSQAWRQSYHRFSNPEDHHDQKTAVSEIQMLREVMFLLQGLKTSLFDENGAPIPSFQMAHVAWPTHKSLIGSFAECGGYLEVLRDFVDQPQTVPHIQSLQDKIDEELSGLDQHLVTIQKRLASPSRPEIASLLALKNELSPWLESLFQLANIVTKAQTPGSSVFSYLEHLHEAATNAQMSGNPAAYEFLARIFLCCFDVYLRPIRRWIDQGKLSPSNEYFFISEDTMLGATGNIWHHRYRLCYSEDGQLLAPSFLAAPARTICNTGKSVVVLRLLGQVDPHPQPTTGGEPLLTYEAICAREMDLVPFGELFALAFDNWIEFKQGETCMILKDILIRKHGLYSALSSLKHLYFMADGAASNDLLNRLFERADAKAAKWHDRHELTGLAQDIFSQYVDSSRLTCSIAEDDKTTKQFGAMQTALPSVKLQYRLPWSVQMVVSEESLLSYHVIFTFLAQIKRALYSLANKKKFVSLLGQINDGHDATAYLFFATQRSLLWFCNSLLQYLCTIVLEPTSIEIQQQMEQVSGLDEMASSHEACLKKALNHSCLGKNLTSVHDSIMKILNLAIELDTATAKLKPGMDYHVYSAFLRQTQSIFYEKLCFITDSLKNVAGASGNDVDRIKWDLLSDILQQGRPDVVMRYSARQLG